MHPVVAYLRISPSEPAASDLALREQRSDVERYLNDIGAYVVEEFIEEASGHTGEAFVAACHAAVLHDATLVIGSLQLIGSGRPLTQLNFPVLREGFTLATGGPWMPHIEPVILGEPLDSEALDLDNDEVSQAQTVKYAAAMYEHVNKMWADRGSEILQGACGFSILNGPPIFRPKLMIIGANGGFGANDSEPHIDKQLPESSSILTAAWPLARIIRKLFDLWALSPIHSKTIETNFLFFASSSIEKKSAHRWHDVDDGLRTELERFCRHELIGYVEVSQPQAILVLGIGSFNQHATEIEDDSTVYDGSQKRRLLMKGRVFGVPAFGIPHPTGTRVADEDWRRVGPHIREALMAEHP